MKTARSGLRLHPGAVLFPALALLLFVPLAAAFMPIFEGGPIHNLGRALAEPRFVRSFKYGLSQAAASAVFSAVVGLPGAFLLARRRFPGKRLLSALSAVPFCVPPLIIAIGFVLFYGREGFLNRVLMSWLGLEEPPIVFLYSFAGVVLAHGFYNFPVVMRLVGDAWASAPVRHVEAARLLGASNTRIFFTITLPAILPALGAALSLVFLMCFYSFVIVLLFGGPGVGTPEVELYRAARFEFDSSLASAFALSETVLAMSVLYLYGRFEKHAALERIEAEPSAAVSFKSRAGVVLAVLYGLGIAIFFIGPLVAIATESLVVRTTQTGSPGFGFGNYISLFARRGFGLVLLNTALLGTASALIATLTGFMLTLGLKKSRSVFLAKTLPLIPLGVSSVVLAYGWSIVQNFLPGRASVLTLAAIQAVSAYPFVYKAVQSSVGLSDERYAEAARTLGSTRLGVLLRIHLPMALPSLASGFALAFAMSAGDANAIIVMPVRGFETLSLFLYRLAGAYRLNEACAAAVLLALASGFIFLLKDARNGFA